jgi:hypothetical protein
MNINTLPNGKFFATLGQNIEVVVISLSWTILQYQRCIASSRRIKMQIYWARASLSHNIRYVRKVHLQDIPLTKEDHGLNFQSCQRHSTYSSHSICPCVCPLVVIHPKLQQSYFCLL